MNILRSSKIQTNFRAGDDEEDDFQFADIVDEPMDYDAELGEGPEMENTVQKWARPNMQVLDPKKDAVVFQQIDIDHYTGSPMQGMPGAQVNLLNMNEIK